MNRKVLKVRMAKRISKASENCRKLLLNSLLTLSVIFSVQTAHAQGSNIPTFAELCNAPGVIKCVGFDNASEIDPWVVPASQDIVRARLDTTVRASGGGSLRFEIPGLTGSNNSGSWMAPMGQGFGQYEKFYVMFKQRFSPVMLDSTIKWGAGWKQVIFHKRGSSCGAVELTTQNLYKRNFPQMYTSCGARQLEIRDSQGIKLEQGDYNCYYGQYNSEDCAFYAADQWMVFYWEVEIGQWRTNTSKIRAFVAYEGQPLKQYIDVPNFELSYNDSEDDTYSTVQITPYSTDKVSTEDHPTAYTWYDELIVSTQPIAYPRAAGATRPDAPTDLETN